MRKDIKIGMLIGLGFVIVGLIVISSWPGSTVEDRLIKSANQPDPDEKQRVDPVIAPPIEYVINPPQDTDVQAAKDADQRIDITPEPDETLTRIAEHVVNEFREPVKKAGPRIHIVADNENLSNIAKLHYGDANKWTLIAEANKNTITNVNRLSPGMRLVIPKPK